MSTFKPVYSYVDIYVTDNNGRVLEGIMVFEDKDSEGLSEVQYRYDSRRQDLTLYGYDVADFSNIEELREDMHLLLFNKRQDNKRNQDVMWHPLEALAYTIGHWVRRLNHLDVS